MADQDGEKGAATGGEADGNLHHVNVDDVGGKVFVGGLSWQTTEEGLRFYFEKYGELSDVALMIDKRTGSPRYKQHYQIT